MFIKAVRVSLPVVCYSRQLGSLQVPWLDDEFSGAPRKVSRYIYIYTGWNIVWGAGRLTVF